VACRRRRRRRRKSSSTTRRRSRRRYLRRQAIGLQRLQHRLEALHAELGHEFLQRPHDERVRVIGTLPRALVAASPRRQHHRRRAEAVALPAEHLGAVEGEHGVGDCAQRRQPLHHVHARGVERAHRCVRHGVAQRRRQILCHLQQGHARTESASAPRSRSALILAGSLRDARTHLRHASRVRCASTPNNGTNGRQLDSRSRS
jgi:hypothetical protein